MKNIKNFKRYHPDAVDKKWLEHAVEAIFLISEDGQDWYACQKNFQTDTMKVEYEADGVIRSMGYDISGFCPEGCSIAEVYSINFKMHPPTQQKTRIVSPFLGLAVHLEVY